MKAAIKRLRGDGFWRNNAIFLTGALAASFLNYLYHPVLGRFLDVSSFGEVQVLLAIFNVAAMLLAAFQIVIINISANNEETGPEVVRHLEHLALMVMAVAFVSLSLYSVQLKEFFSFSSSLPFIALGATLVASVLVTLRQGYIQGRSNFRAVSLSNVFAAMGKLLFSTLLVLAGFAAFGAMAGILAANVLVFLYAARVAGNMGFAASPGKKLLLPNFSLLKPELSYLLSVMAVFLIVTLLYSGDVLVVKRYFDAEVAGLYAGIAAIAKIVFFATASFTGVLLASVGTSYSPQHNRRVSEKSLLLVLLIGGGVTVLFALFPEPVIRLLLGEKYLSFSYLLPPLSAVVLVASVANLFFYYLLALRRFVALPIAVASGAATLALTVFRHETLEEVIQNFLVGGVSMLCLLVGLELYSRVKAGKPKR